MVTGIPAAAQKLTVFDTAEKQVVVMDDHDRKLGSYAVEENYRIHVTNIDGSAGNTNIGAAGIMDFNDTSQVEKYELSEDAYDKMSSVNGMLTVREMKRRAKEGRFNEEEMARKAAEKEANDKQYAEMQDEKQKS